LFTTVNKSKDSPVDAAKKKAELEKRLQDVSGQLSGTKSSKSSKKNAGKLAVNQRISVITTKMCENNRVCVNLCSACLLACTFHG